MSELSKNINTEAKRSLDCQATMLHAFDLPLTEHDLGLITNVIGANAAPEVFRMSLSIEDGKLILGFENIENGNRVVITYNDLTAFDIPEWLLGDNVHLVTRDAISMIDTTSRYRFEQTPLQTVAVLNLEGLWIADNIDWTLRQQHLTGADAQQENELSNLVTINPGRFIGGRAIVNANGRIEINTVAKVAFKNARMAKTLLGKAGKSKPQGDLIVYFSEDSCAAEGYNSTGNTTLELSPVGGNRQLKAYESSIEGDTILGVKFGYPFWFRILFSAKDGILQGDVREAIIDYGVTNSEKPYLAIHEPNKGRTIEIAIESEASVFKEADLTLPELNLASKPNTRTTKTVAPKVIECPTLTWDDLNIDIPEGYEEDIKRWFDAYSETKTVIDANLIDVSAWFSAYLMKQAREAQPISVRDRDAYREVTELLKN